MLQWETEDVDLSMELQGGVAVVALDLILQFRLGFSSLPKCSDFDGQNFAQLFAPPRTPFGIFWNAQPEAVWVANFGPDHLTVRVQL